MPSTLRLKRKALALGHPRLGPPWRSALHITASAMSTWGGLGWWRLRVPGSGHRAPPRASEASGTGSLRPRPGPPARGGGQLSAPPAAPLQTAPDGLHPTRRRVFRCLRAAPLRVAVLGLQPRRPPARGSSLSRSLQAGRVYTAGVIRAAAKKGVCPGSRPTRRRPGHQRRRPRGRKLASGGVNSARPLRRASSRRKSQNALGMRAEVRRDRVGPLFHRWYQPGMGSYTRPDPLGLSGDVHPYLYAQANPLALIDPFGEKSRTCCTPITGGGPLAAFKHCFIETVDDEIAQALGAGARRPARQRSKRRRPGRRPRHRPRALPARRPREDRAPGRQRDPLRIRPRRAARPRRALVGRRHRGRAHPLRALPRRQPLPRAPGGLERRRLRPGGRQSEGAVSRVANSR